MVEAVNSAPAPVRELHNVTPQTLMAVLQDRSEPVVLRGLVAEWPVVQKAHESDGALHQYLREFDSGVPLNTSVAPSAAGGRVFYNDDMSGFNFTLQRLQLNQLLEKLQVHAGDVSAPLYYVGSTSVDYCLPQFREHHPFGIALPDPLVSLWLGNRTKIPAHYDIPDNIACVAAGRRHFTLFPPDQLPNLYVGPIDFAPAGQSVSLVDVTAPDFERFPRFHDALRQALTCELKPGDALFIPSMWWHHVEGLDDTNMLINYWWRSSPAFMGVPMDALHHALLSIRDLPSAQKQAWQQFFDYYVFQDNEETVAHIPEKRRGLLAPLAENAGRRLRAILLKQLNR